MIFPPSLKEGDLVAIVAPSSPFDEERYRLGEAWLRERYRLRVRDDLCARKGYLAGDDDRRFAELHDAMTDPEVRAIVAARGGYGATRIVSRLDFQAFSRAPKWIVGFSDVTALHVEASRVGVASMHAAMVASLGGDASLRPAWLDALEGRPLADFTPLDGLETVVAGEAVGRAFGGNLALLEACAAAGRLVVPEGAVVFLEDCTERPYRVDRMLTSILVGGHFARAAAFVLGDFTDCNPGPDRVTVDDVLRERLGTLGVPVVRGAPFGHGKRNAPIVLGGEVRVGDGCVRRSG